ncbi:hypothetical protein HMPREF2626_01590 [Aerococcus sp. HMSC062A02]|uniref:phage head-tail connector protein n=1 Tax=Aerococcus sp. HMSC062A02 TaxID=1715105 RepID=UPI0008A32D7D|nr:phage head-tail connector protein [Aerococcus sp. HMSC062A02]OFN02630.1 hypothetical protein HMPREF2626_01590 [Aerococcus sp. HMSC062A02]
MSEVKRTILERIRLRIGSDVPDELLEDFIQIVQDRINLRLAPYSPTNFPTALDSIVVEVVIAMSNKAELHHEGVDNEKVDVYSMKFIQDLLKPYLEDIDLFRQTLIPEEAKVRGGGIKFI